MSMRDAVNHFLASITLAHRAIAEKPMNNEGIPEPTLYKLGAKPTRYKPCPNNPPRCGSKRKRQWK